MYKLESAVANGGETIIYAPRITGLGYTHGKQLAEIGYHVRDYFLKQWEKFGHYPGAMLAHSTHLKGTGYYGAHTRDPRSEIVFGRYPCADDGG